MQIKNRFIRKRIACLVTSVSMFDTFRFDLVNLLHRVFGRNFTLYGLSERYFVTILYAVVGGMEQAVSVR